MSKLAKALTAAAGNAGESLYVEDVFSTYLYDGVSSAITITNGIDLADAGGLVWTKRRATDARSHILFDSERGASSRLMTDQTAAAANQPYSITMNSDGYSWSGADNDVTIAGSTYASWTFRKAEKFFDVVTYTGNGVAGRTVAHNLGSTPATIIIKCTTDTQSWVVYHTSLGATKYLTLNTTNASGTTSVTFNDTEPTDSLFSVGTAGSVNASGQTYVAYLFASDAGGFGDDGSENIIKCGSFATGAQGKISSPVDCGFEPQWLLVKNSGASENWNLYDVMRGLTVEADAILNPNLSNAEDTGTKLTVTATGFDTPLVNGPFASGASYIYIAIRRPMKTPESGTEVFSVDTYNQTSASAPAFNLGAVVDFGLRRINNFESNWTAQTRLTGDKGLTPNATDAESTQNYGNWDNMVGWYQGASITPPYSQANWYGWSFKRATGFFDVVAYTGDDVSTRTVAHNLSVTPELMIVKRRDGTGNWPTYHKGTSANPEQNYLFLNSTQAVLSSISYWNYTAPTNTHFSVRTNNDVNGVIGGKYIAYLFATLAGVSKVGSYTGTGSNVDVDCGFSAGARFILIKRTDSTGDWYVYDSARGIVAGNDPYLLLSSTAAEVTSTDYIDPLSSGFTVTSSAPAALNASGGSYIFLAIS